MQVKIFTISKLKNDPQGFTLIEVMISVAILTIGILAAASMQTAATTANAKASRLTEAVNEAQNQIELIAGMNYDAVVNGSTTSPDGRYNVSWNVTLNQPIANTKTIVVSVTWTERGAPRVARFKYIKAQVI